MIFKKILNIIRTYFNYTIMKNWTRKGRMRWSIRINLDRVPIKLLEFLRVSQVRNSFWYVKIYNCQTVFLLLVLNSGFIIVPVLVIEKIFFTFKTPGERFIFLYYIQNRSPRFLFVKQMNIQLTIVYSKNLTDFIDLITGFIFF